jgi:hypothetical protein
MESSNIDEEKLQILSNVEIIGYTILKLRSLLAFLRGGIFLVLEIFKFEMGKDGFYFFFFVLV